MNKKQKKTLERILIAVALVIVLKLLPALPMPVELALYCIPYLVVGWDVLRKALKGIKNRQPFDECFLMAVATVGAFALGDYVEGCAVIIFYQIGELFQSYAVGKSRRNISDLMDIRPDYANVEREGQLVQVDPEEVSVGVVNGKVTLSSASQTAAGQVLVVNGKLMITPDAAEVLQKYACILVNGMIYCPQCLSAVVSARCILNGKLAVYPDDAVLLPGSSIKLDNTFLLRAQSRLYWNEHRFLAVDPRLDTAALAAKGCSFSAPKAILCASLAPVLAPLFPDSTELIIVPDGTAVVEDDLELTASSLRRYGTRLYVLGDAVIPAESADLLAQIEFLHVTGEVELPDALEAAFFAIPELECGKVVHEDALPKLTRAKAKDEEPDPDTVTLSGIQLTL